MDFILIGFLLLAAFWAGSNWRARRASQDAEEQSDVPSPPPKPEPQMSQGERLVMILFLSGWLIAWSTGIYMAAQTLMSGDFGGGNLFLVGWLIAASAGWVAAVATLISAIRGKRSIFTRRR